MEQLKLKREGIIKFELVDENDKPTGEYLEFDLESIDLPLRYQECIEQHKRNIANLRNKIMIIEKKQDHKGKKLLSANEEAKMYALNEYYQKEMEALDLFLGENGTKKVLNGRKPYLSMFDDVNEMMTPVMPKLSKGFENIKEKIMKKYDMKEEDVIE